MRDATDTLHQIQAFLEKDHKRLAGLLERTLLPSEQIALPLFDMFRKGLLTHIGIEEKLLFPISKLGTPEQQQTAALLRLQHGAIASLLVLDPSQRSIGALRHILEIHNSIEEGDSGFYSACESLAANDREQIAKSVESFPEVPVAQRPHTPHLIESVRRALVRAGFAASLLD